MGNQKYSKKVLEHFKKPHNQGVIKNPDAVGLVGNPKCGDIMRLYIKVGKNKKGEEIIEAELVLTAVGISPNIENLGIEELGIKTERQFVVVDNYYKTNVEGIYAIGDIIKGPALAHVASSEGIICVDKIAGRSNGIKISIMVLNELARKLNEASSSDLSSCPKPAIPARIPTGTFLITIEIITITAVPVR